jgi:predicted P-loop ATPase
MALMPPIMADRYRGLLIDRGLARANLIDAELARRRNGAEPDEPGEPQQETGQRGRPRKYKLVTDDYIALYQKWGYKVHLNLCQDDVEVNGEYLGDIQLDTIFSKVRDYGTNTKTSVNVQHAKESLSVLAARHSYHPIKDYLDALTWDGKENILALSNYLIGVDDKAQRHVMQWLYHWCVAAVAKIYEGYQSPMLVLDAPQDAGKDYFARWLCPLPEYFIESPIVPDSKDHRLRLVQTFVWDVAELGSTTRRADVEALKAFITLGKVRERKPYGKREIIKPALASFIGTINNDAGFLVDRTGNRRFLVCALKAFDWSYTQHVDVHQIWAQAVHVYKSGDGDWKLDTAAKAERDEINEGYMIDTPTEVRLEALYEFTDDPTDIVLLNTILNDLGIYNVKETTGVTMAIAGTLKKWGAVKDRREKKGVKERFYRKIRAKTRPTDQPDQPSL